MRCTLIILSLLAGALSAAEPLLNPAWKVSRITGAETVYIIRGTGDRNNPIRRALAKPFTGPELFVRFRLRYDAASIDTLGPQNELEARIRSYELAFHMQTAAPELFDLKKETAATRKLYGLDKAETRNMAQGCLLARRMVERGVRFVQVRVGGWDAHGNIKANHTRQCTRTDQPIAALLTDLRQRGLLKCTLVVWGGEFGRTPTMEGRANGRDHSPAGYTSWLSGGGAKGGQTIGATDPIGYVATERPVSVPDFHATLLHTLGLDAHRLSYRHHGREEKPIVFGGNAVKEVFA